MKSLIMAALLLTISSTVSATEQKSLPINLEEIAEFSAMVYDVAEKKEIEGNPSMLSVACIAETDFPGKPVVEFPSSGVIKVTKDVFVIKVTDLIIEECYEPRF